MAININQFAPQAIQGQRDMNFGGTVFSGFISPSDPNTSIPGHPMKLDSTIGNKALNFLQATAASDPIVGFALYNLKDTSYAAYQRVEVACSDSVLYLTASELIGAGAKVEVNISTTAPTVKNWGGTNTIVGIALDDIQANSLGRVFVVAQLS